MNLFCLLAILAWALTVTAFIFGWPYAWGYLGLTVVLLGFLGWQLRKPKPRKPPIYLKPQALHPINQTAPLLDHQRAHALQLMNHPLNYEDLASAPDGYYWCGPRILYVSHEDDMIYADGVCDPHDRERTYYGPLVHPQQLAS